MEKKQSDAQEKISEPQAKSTGRREFLQQAGLAGSLLASLGLTADGAMAQTGSGSAFLTPPLDIKVVDMRQTPTANGVEMTLVNEMTDVNGLRAVSTAFLKRADYGGSYTVFVNTAIQYYVPPSDQPAHVSNYAVLQYGHKGAVSGEERTDTLETFIINNGLLKKQQQTVKVQTNAMSQFEGLSPDEIAKKMFELKQNDFERAQESAMKP